MYIGPWQEYNLSKSKGNKPKAAINSSLKSEIQNAILNSLDPAAAATALSTLTPFFEKAAAQDAPAPSMVLSTGRRKPAQKPPRILPVLDMYERSSGCHGEGAGANIIQDRQGDHSQQHQPILHVNSARNMPLHSSSPLASVRTTRSEPSAAPVRGGGGRIAQHSPIPPPNFHSDSSMHKGSKNSTVHVRSHAPPKSTNRAGSGRREVARTGQSVQQQAPQQPQGHSGSSGNSGSDNASSIMPMQVVVKASHRQPVYNSSAAVNILKLEREERARNSIASLTGWKRGDHAGGTTSATSSIGGKGDSSTSSSSSNAPVASSSLGGSGGGKDKKASAASRLTEQKMGQVSAMKEKYMRQELQQKQPWQQHHQQSAAGTSSAAEVGTGVLLPSLAQHAQHVASRELNLNETVRDGSNVVLGQYSAAVSRNRVQSPVKNIQDLDLTDNELTQISKYFKQVGGTGDASNAGVGTGARHIGNDSSCSGNGSAGINCSNLKLPLISPADTMKLSPKKITSTVSSPSAIMRGMAAPMTDSRPDTGKSFVSTTSRSRLATAQKDLSMASNFDELYMGGIDGLLKWSSQLDADIDAL